MTRKARKSDYHNLDNIRFELESIWQSHQEQKGKIPSLRWLRNNGYESLVAGIYRSGSSIGKVRSKLKLTGGERNSYWRVPRNALNEAHTYINEHRYDKLPAAETIRIDGRDDLVSGISRHYGFNRFRKMLGEAEVSRPYGSLKDPKNIAKEIKKILKPREIEEIPNFKTLRKMGHSNLARASSRFKYHSAIIAATGIKPKIDSSNISLIIERIIAIHSLRKFPGRDKLKHLGYKEVAFFIDRNNGFTGLRKTMGVKARRPDGGLKDKGYVLEEVSRVMRENEWGELPSPTVLTKKGYSSLTLAISSYHGGFRNFREVIRQTAEGKSEGQVLESMLEHYLGCEAT